MSIATNSQDFPLPFTDALLIKPLTPASSLTILSAQSLLNQSSSDAPLPPTQTSDGAAQTSTDSLSTSSLSSVAPAASSVTYVSDLPWTSTTNGWGPAEKDTSNGEQAAGDGKPIALRGVTYPKGLGVHANSELTYSLNGNYTQFVTDVGVDDETRGQGSVDFQVWADGVQLFDSGTLTGSSPTLPVQVDVTGKQTLKLVVTPGPDLSYDHADWAGARLLSSPVSSPVLPTTPIEVVTAPSTPVSQPTLPTPTPAPKALSPAWDDSTLPNEGHPAGVPSYYSWYNVPTIGWGNNPRTDWNAFTAWGQIYAESGWNPPANSNTRVQLRDIEAWYLSKSTGQWKLLQNATRVDGADYKEDFSNNSSKGSDVRDESSNGGGTSITAGNGWNYHFWTDRVTIDPTDIGGIYTRFQSRLILDDPNKPDDRASARYLGSAGADYWRSVSAPWAADWSNNGGVGSGRFKFITNDWQNFSMETLPVEQLLQNPPPIS